MKRPHFKACNHGCRARRQEGMGTNGGCNFPARFEMIKDQTGLMMGYHHDEEVRKYARKIMGLLDHIYFEE